MSNNGWRTVPISEIYHGLYDGPHATPKPSDEGPVFLGIKNIREDGLLDLSSIRHIAEEDFPRWTKRVQPQPGDIVFAYEAALNRYAVIPDGFRGCLGRRLALIRPRRERVDVRFLFYYFFGKEWRDTVAQKTILGATVDRIPLIEFPNFPITIPPLTIQRKIAAILSAYDDLIENNRRRIEILEEMARLIYREWFVHFRFPGHKNVKLIDSALGEIPEEWKVVPLEFVCERITDGAHRSPKSVDEGLPMASVKDMHDWGFGLSKCRHIEKAEFDELVRADCKPKKNDVLIAKDGSYLKHCFVVENEIDLVVLSSIAMLRPNGLLNPHALAMCLRDPSARDRLKNYVSGVAIPRIVLKDFRQFPIVLPPKSTQEQFGEIVEPMITSCWRLIDKNENLQQTRDLLLPRLLSGELDVSELPIETGADNGDGD